MGDEKREVGGLTWVCPKCEYEDDITVRLEDLNDVIAFLVSAWFRLQPDQRVLLCDVIAFCIEGWSALPPDPRRRLLDFAAELQSRAKGPVVMRW